MHQAGLFISIRVVLQLSCTVMRIACYQCLNDGEISLPLEVLAYRTADPWAFLFPTVLCISSLYLAGKSYYCCNSSREPSRSGNSRIFSRAR